MSEDELKIIHRLCHWANFCAGEGLFNPNGDDPADILMDLYQRTGGFPDWFPKALREEWGNL